MKKRLLAALLVIAMMASMIVMPAYATESAAQTQVGYCQHCKQVIPEDQWIPWNPANKDPYSGHYYLAEDTSSQEEQITIGLNDDLLRHKICLDLRGHSYMVKGFRPFLISGIFSIMDSVGGGEIAVTGQTSNANGAFCQMYKKTGVADGSSGELNIYSGTLRRINTAEQVVAKGGLIYLASGSTLNVHGGKLIGGDVKGRLNSSGEAVAPLGGTIYATGANVNICGGTITGGVANDTTVTLSNGTTQDCEAYGGNIYAVSGSKVTISGGSVENGYSDTYAGNIYVKESSLEITGGTVTGGYSEGAVGNIYVTGSGSSFKMSGGTVKNGVCVTRGGNLFVNNKNVDIDISGGEIYGDMSVEKFKSFKLSGSPKIYMGLGNGLRLQAENTAANIDVTGLTEGAEIYLDGTDQIFTDVLEDPETYLTYFKDAIRADISVDETGALKVVQSDTGFCPHCWKSGEQANWTVWGNKAGSSSSGIYSITSSVHYYLSEDCVRDKPGKESGNRMGLVSAGSSSVTTNDVVIDTAGHNWTTADNKVFNVRSTLSLVDSVGSGKIIGTGKKTAAGNGGMIQVVNATSVFNLYSGTLMRTISDDDYINDLMGGILYAPAGSSVNIYGGTIRDGVSASVSAADTSRACKGGNICALGNFTMTAGALIGGKAYANSYILQDTANPIVIDEVNTTLAGTGGNLYLAGVATISGGHIVDGTATQGGGVYIANSATPTISGCVIRGGIAGETAGAVDSTVDLSFNGGNLYIAGASDNRQELTLSDSIIRSGDSKEAGGNIYADYTDLTLRDAAITDGHSGTAGGNVSLSKTAVCDMYDSVIGNGDADSNGGNLYGPKGSVFDMHSGLITGGNADTSGGNIYCTGVTISGGTVTGGYAKTRGGNIYVLKSGNTLRIEDDGDNATPAPVISNGYAKDGAGDNIYLGDGNTGILTGAIIRNGEADSILAYNNTTLTMTDCTVEGIVVNSSSGNGVCAYGALTLKGNTNITNEQNQSCVYIGGNGSLTVDAGFTGTASVAFADAHFENVEEPQGAPLAEQNTAGGVFTGKLFLEGHESYDYSLPAIFAVAGDNKLYIASTAVVNEATGEIVWFKDAAAAAAELDDGEYLRLHGTDNAMELSDDLVVDLNGKNLNVTGTGTGTKTIYGFDSSNDDYDGYGTVSATGVSVEPSYFAPNGNQYVTLTDGNGVISFHRMGIRISSVSLKPTVSGVYYEGIWECDDVLADKVDTFGIALSTDKMPDKNFANDTDYTEHTKDEFVNGEAQTSVLVYDILKEEEGNQDRGVMKIYAIPYVIIDNGIVTDFTLVSNDNNPGGAGADWTLKDVLQSVNYIWPKLNNAQQEAVRDMYDIDADVLDTWNLYNITADINGTPAIRPLKILTLGHSLAVDSNHMLNLVADTEGYSENFVIGTLYYSGCPLYKHVNFLTDNSPVYSLYLSSTETPDAPPIIINDVTMQFGVEYDDWDIIIMQGGVFEIGRESTYTNGHIQTIQNYVNEHKTNPDAIFAWHMAWAPPTDNDLRDMFPGSSNSYYTSYAAWNHDRSTLYKDITGLVNKYIVTDSSFIYMIPSGTAIENALSSYLEEKDLHRDYVHVSDLGRVIAAYTWYCTLASIDHLEEIKLNAIPMAFLKSTADKTQDRVLTEAEKAVILEAVNNALANPLEMTQSQYTTAPTN